MNRHRQAVFILLAIAAVAGLAYLPLISSFGYTHDDWYLMYAAKAYGPQAFRAIFSIDRPLRAYLMIPAYALFGENPLWYNLSAFVFRCLGAFAFWWLLKMLWPKNEKVAFLAAILFAVYPGFLSQPNAIDYQSHLVALCLAMLSLALTVRYALEARLPQKLLWLAGAALSGWVYLGLMEYYIGFELIRFALLLLLAFRERGSPARWLRQLASWLPLALIGGLFLLWRLYYFAGGRSATDPDVQLSISRRAVLELPALLWKNSLDVILNAWFVPLSESLPGLDAGRLLIGLVLVVVGVILVLFLFSAVKEDDPGWGREALFLGLFGVAAGLLPILLANRAVAFPHYSRYTLVSCMGAALLCTGLTLWIPWRWARQAFLAVLIAAALGTHFANSVKYARETASMNAFWWQVSWRVPQLESATTLIAHYPVVSTEEDYFIWGPANLIYYPQKMHPDGIQPVLYAAIPNDLTTERVLQQVRQVYDKRRTIVTYANYRNILILTRPTADSCVQVLDGLQPELSSSETARFISMAPFSEMEHVLPDETGHRPPPIVFGAEPPHDWCYFYEKASLARQRGDSEEVIRLADEAQAAGFKPHDQIEWMPFLQAYALQGDVEHLTTLSGAVTDVQVRGQACQILGGLKQAGAGTRTVIQRIFCGQ